MQTVRVLDSHTGGEPTRLVLAGGPDLGAGTVAERAAVFARTGDDFRRMVLSEPRGSDVYVGALLAEPSDPAAQCGVIFFNTAANLGMCGHGLIGLVESLAYLGRLPGGPVTVETPAGLVTATRDESGAVTFENVPSERYATSVSVDVPGVGALTGDVAYGGNWFYLVEWPHGPITLDAAPDLTRVTTAVRRALDSNGVTGRGGALIDHIELCGPPRGPANHSRNFVLTPSGAFDRSPCGTGTSAKLACLAASGKLKPGEVWRQESVCGSVFEGRYAPLADGRVVPTLTGRAFVAAESILLFDPADPFRLGLREAGAGE